MCLADVLQLPDQKAVKKISEKYAFRVDLALSQS